MSVANGQAKNGQPARLPPKPRYRDDDDYRLSVEGRVGIGTYPDDDPADEPHDDYECPHEHETDSDEPDDDQTDDSYGTPDDEHGDDHHGPQPESADVAETGDPEADRQHGDDGQTEQPAEDPEYDEPAPEPELDPTEAPEQYLARVEAMRLAEPAPPERVYDEDGEEIIDPAIVAASDAARKEREDRQRDLQTRYWLATGELQPSEFPGQEEAAERIARVGRVLLRQLHDPDLDSDEGEVARHARQRQEIQFYRLWPQVQQWTQSARRLTIGELFEREFPVEYLVRQFLAKGAQCIWGGPEKSLKTSLALHLSLCLASGLPFLGFAVLHRCRVGFCSGESTEPVVKETLRRIARDELRIRNPGDLLDRLQTQYRVPAVGDPVAMTSVETWLAAELLEVLVVDPAYLAVPGEGSSYLTIMGERLRQLSEMCQRHGTTLILLHHAVKSASRHHEPMTLADLSGSGFGPWAAQWVLMNRRSDYDPAGKNEIWLTWGGRAGHSGTCGLDIDESTIRGMDGDPPPRSWKAKVRDTQECRAKQKQDKAKGTASEKSQQTIADVKTVIAALREKGPETERALRGPKGLTDLSKDRVEQALGRALRQGLIETATVTKNGKSYDGYVAKDMPDAMDQ